MRGALATPLSVTQPDAFTKLQRRLGCMLKHRVVPSLLLLVISLTALAQRPNPDGDRLFVPVVVHAGGIASQFRSDVFLFNRGEAGADLSLTFTPSGTDGTSQFKTVRRFLPPGNLVTYEDIVASLSRPPAAARWRSAVTWSRSSHAARPTT